jgi:hypothetical protein
MITHSTKSSSSAADSGGDIGSGWTLTQEGRLHEEPMNKFSSRRVIQQQQQQQQEEGEGDLATLLFSRGDCAPAAGCIVFVQD